VQLAPVACGGPQCPFGAQTLPVAQSAFDAQEVLHDEDPQT